MDYPPIDVTSLTELIYVLSIKEITKICKGTKITSRENLYKTTKRAGQKISQQQDCRGVVLRNFATYEI